MSWRRVTRFHQSLGLFLSRAYLLCFKPVYSNRLLIFSSNLNPAHFHHGKEARRREHEEGCRQRKGPIATTVQSSQARPLADCVYIQKAEAANQKLAAESAKKAIAEDQEWSKGAKSNAKKCVPSPASKLH